MRISDWSSDVCSSDLAATRDREHVLDRHQEGLVDRTFRLRNPAIDGFHQLQDGFLADIVVAAFDGGERRTGDDRNIVAVEVAPRKLFADFEFDELEQLGVVDLVDLVQEHDHGRNADLLRSEEPKYEL